MPPSKKTMPELRTEDKQVLPVSPLLMKHSDTIRYRFKAKKKSGNVFDVPIKSLDLALVENWLKHYDEWMRSTNNGTFRSENKLHEWEKELMTGFDHKRLLSLQSSARYLKIPEFVKCINFAIGEWLHGKSPDELQCIFNIPRPFTEEEKAKIESGRQRFWQQNGPGTNTPEKIGEDQKVIAGSEKANASALEIASISKTDTETEPEPASADSSAAAVCGSGNQMDATGKNEENQEFGAEGEEEAQGAALEFAPVSSTNTGIMNLAEQILLLLLYVFLIRSD